MLEKEGKGKARSIYILAYILFGNEKLRAEIFFGDQFMIDHRHGSNPCEDQILGDFIRKRSHGYDEDMSRTKPI